MLEAARQPVYDDSILDNFDTKSTKGIARRKTTRKKSLRTSIRTSPRHNPRNNSRRNSSNSAKLKLRVIAAILTIFVFGVYYTSLSASIAGKSYELEQLQREIAQLETSNERMELTLNSMSSLEKVESIAVKDLGLEKRAADTAALVATADLDVSANGAEGEQPSEGNSGKGETQIASRGLIQAIIDLFKPGSAQASNTR